MSTALRRQLKESVEAILRENGVETWKTSKTGKHVKYAFVWQDRDTMFTIAATPSDQRCMVNAESCLRKILGVKRQVHKNPDNRARPKRKAKAAALEMPAVTVMPDPWQALARWEPPPPRPQHHATYSYDDLPARPSIWQRIATWFRGWVTA